MLANAIAELSAYSLIELAAVATSLAYIVLAARNNRLCWITAFISSVLFVIILWRVRLVMDTGLNVFYAVMAVYGWLSWQQKEAEADDSGIGYWPIKHHAIAITSIVILALISGWLLANHTDAAFPYLDSLTTWGALFATWLLVKKIVDCWLYWVVLDAISIYLYYHKELYFTLLLFVVFTVMSVYAYWNWRKIGSSSSGSTVSIDKDAAATS